MKTLIKCTGYTFLKRLSKHNCQLFICWIMDTHKKLPYWLELVLLLFYSYIQICSSCLTEISRNSDSKPLFIHFIIMMINVFLPYVWWTKISKTLYGLLQRSTLYSISRIEIYNILQLVLVNLSDYLFWCWSIYSAIKGMRMFLKFIIFTLLMSHFTLLYSTKLIIVLDLSSHKVIPVCNYIVALLWTSSISAKCFSSTSSDILI